MHIRGDVAKVHARYSCDVGNHIWVSVKQNDSATVEPGSRGELQKGWGWVQFCITTDERLDAVKMEWSRVVKN